MTTTTHNKLPSRARSEQLLTEFISNQNLIHHCHMVATALGAYAVHLQADEELWYQTGLLHDLDWEKFPDEHPNHATQTLLSGYPQALIDAVASHAPSRSGRQPQSKLDKYLFACDELGGFMHAVSLMRPNGFADMKPKSIIKKLKDKSFASNVSRDDINQGFELIGKTPDEHIALLIKVFQRMENYLAILLFLDIY